jgi:hypothetical protein
MFMSDLAAAAAVGRADQQCRSLWGSRPSCNPFEDGGGNFMTAATVHAILLGSRRVRAAVDFLLAADSPCASIFIVCGAAGSAKLAGPGSPNRPQAVLQAKRAKSRRVPHVREITAANPRI